MLKFLAGATGYVVGTFMFIFFVLGLLALSPFFFLAWLGLLLFARAFGRRP